MTQTTEFMKKHKMTLGLILLLVMLYFYLEKNDEEDEQPMKKVEFNTDIIEEAPKKEKSHHEDESKTKKSDYWDFDGNMRDELADADHEFTNENLGSGCAGKNAAFVSADLLPKVSEKDQPFSPDLKGMKLLDPEEFVGIDTVSNTLRNANLSIRKEPPNPKTPVSPWLNSTIESDPYRKGLECE